MKNAPSFPEERVEPDRNEFHRKAKTANLIPVHAEILADDLTPISAYRTLVGDGTGFLLESVERGEKVGRYSFIGLEPWDVLSTAGEDPLAVVERRM
ncbi:MAG: anthranilate synthase component I, partial [Candidatus Hydrogenedentota bacterium]